VLVLKNMVTMAELTTSSDEEFQDTLDDVRDECNKFGKVVQVVIPRPTKDGADGKYEEGKDGDDGRRGLGVGRIFVHFSEAAEAAKALATLNGRLFNERRVEAAFFSEDKFKARQLDA